MRSLSTTLTNASTALNKQPIWKVILSRSAQSTLGYNNTRVIKISHSEIPDGGRAEIVISNTANVFTTLDLEHYQAVLSYGYKTGVARSTWIAASTYALDAIVVPSVANGYQYRCSASGAAGSSEPTFPTALGVTVADSAATWEMDGNVGDEYSRTAPLRVRAQSLFSGRGILTCTIRCAGILDQLGEDRAINKHEQTMADTRTVQDLMNAIASAGTSLSSAYTTYASMTLTYDSTDSIITSFKPADYFAVQVNDRRLGKLQELINYTGCKMRAENDGNIHVFDPVTSGTAYNEEYKFNVVGDHNFWNEGVRLRFVNPNREIVSSPTTSGTVFAGTATSTASYDLAPKTHTTYRRLASTAEASSIASAMIERYELDDEKGFATVPMNAGQELWDYVKITDSRMGGTTRTGNIQYLQRDVEVHQDNRPLTWVMKLSFGKITQESLMAGIGTEGGEGRNLEAITRLLELHTDKIGEIVDKVNDHTDKLNKLHEVRKLMPALTRWVLPGWYGTRATSTHVAGRIVYTPIFVAEATTYIRIGVEVTTAAAGTCDLRIFNWGSGLPSSLVLSAGTVDTGTIGDKEITISQTLNGGYYFLASRCSGAPTLRGLALINGLISPVAGFGEDVNDAPYLSLLAADAAYADPAPAPTLGLEPIDAAVRLREN